MASRSPPDGFTRRGLLRSGVALGARQALVSVVTFAGILVLSHALTPARFAYVGWTLAVATFFAAVGDLGYGAALIRSGRARALAGAALVAVSRRIVPAAALAAVTLALLPLGAAVRAAALLLVAGAAFVSLTALPTAVLEAEGRFAAVALVEVLQRALLIGLAVVAAAGSGAAWAAPAAGALAAAAGLALALALAGVGRGVGGRGVGGRGVDAALDDGFSRAWLGGRLANQLTYAVYPLVGTAFLGARDLGLVLWALTVSSAPALGGQLCARILFPALSARADPRLHRRAVALLLALGGSAAAAMLVFARPLTELVFGSAWLGGVEVLRLECATTVLGLILTPTAPVLYLLAPPRVARATMIAVATVTAALALALVGPVGLTAISIATVCSSTLAAVAFDRVLRRAGHPGLGFTLAGLAPLAATTALGVLWSPPVHSLPALGLALAGWSLASFGLLAWSLRLAGEPVIGRSGRGSRLGAAAAAKLAGARRRRRQGAIAAASLLTAGLATVGLGGAGPYDEATSAALVAGGLAACGLALAGLRAPVVAPILAVLCGLYVGVSGIVAAVHPARPELPGARQGIAPHVFHATLALGAAASLAALAALMLVAGAGSRAPGRAGRHAANRVSQIASLLSAVGIIGALLAGLRFALEHRHDTSLSTATLASFWHGGAYLILIAQFALAGLGLQLSLRLEEQQERAPRRRLVAPAAGLAALMLASLATGERGFLVEGALVVVAVAVVHRPRTRVLLVPLALAGVAFLGATQAARDALSADGAITPATLARHADPANWERLVENQLASFQWAADVEAYGARLHATNPLLALLAKPIPRQLYPGKPDGLSAHLTEVVYPSAARAGVHFAVPLYAELAYATGTPAGALAGLALLGALIGLAWRRSGGWPRAVQPVARAAIVWAAFVLLRGDLSNGVPAAAALLAPVAIALWWARTASPGTVVVDALAVPAHYSGVGETVLRIGASLRAEPPLRCAIVVRCAADVRPLIARAFPPTATVECPLPSSRPAWRRLAYQLVLAPLRDGRETLVLSASELAAPYGRASRAVVVHDLRRLEAPATASSRAERRLYHALVPRTVAGADAILTVSRTTAARLAEALRPRAPVTVVAVHHGLERRRRRAPAASSATVVVVGAVRAYKGLDTVIAALALLDAQARPRVRWAGSVEVDAQATTPGLELLGWLPEDELAELLDSAAALLAPSRHEGYGLSLLEGLRRGTPILASAIDAHREVAGDAAILFPPGDAAALARLLAGVATGRLALAAAARASAARAAELARDEPSWAGAIRELVGEAPPPEHPGGGAERDGAAEPGEDRGVHGGVEPVAAS